MNTARNTAHHSPQEPTVVRSVPMSAEHQRAYRDRKRGGPPRVPKPHGTVAAYRRHQRAGEEPCAACRVAWSVYQHELYEKRKGKGP